LHYDFKFIAPDGRSFKSVKMFLMASTKVLVPYHSDPPFVNDVDGLTVGAETESPTNELPEKNIQRTPEDLQKLCDSFPKLEESLNHEEGLVGILKHNYDDWRSFFKCNLYDIAIWVLHGLSKGDISSAVQLEAPFFRPDSELLTYSDSGVPPTRFVGVVR